MSVRQAEPPDPEEQERRAIHRQNLGEPFNEQGQMSAEYVEALTDTKLSEGTINVLENLITQDFVLGYLEQGEATEQKWLARIAAQRVIAMHPGEQCVLQGEFRAFLYDDEHEHLQALSDREKERIRQFIKGVFLRVSRSREGWQQDKIGEQVKVSRQESDSSDDGGLLSGILR